MNDIKTLSEKYVGMFMKDVNFPCSDVYKYRMLDSSIKNAKWEL